MERVNKFISKPLIVAFFILLLGGVITYYQGKINSFEEIPEKSKILVANTNIRRGEEIRGSDLKEKEIYAADQHPEGIKDMSQLVGKIALTNIIADREIVSNKVVSKKDWAKDEERELGIIFEHFTDLVGGSVLPGDVVDIMVSYQDSEELEEVITEVEVKDVYDDNNISYKTTKDKFNFKPATILVRITEDEEKAVDIAKKQGRIYLRRHSNYMQVIDIVDDISDEVIISGGE